MYKNRALFLTVLASLLLLLLVGCASAEAADTSVIDLAAADTEPAPQEEPAPPEPIPLNDVAEDMVCYDAVQTVLQRGVMTAEDGDFFPKEKVSRASAVTALRRLAGAAPAQGPTGFGDVAPGAWYEGSVAWALEAGLLSPGDRFRPYDPLTREELTELLSRLATVWGLELAAPQMPSPALPVSRSQLAQAMTALLTCQESGGAVTGTAVWPPVEEPEADPALVQALEDAASRHKAIGVQVAVIRDGELQDTYAWGWATKKTDPMTADHKIRIASLSKVLVGTSAALLLDRNTIDFNADISEYWGFQVKNPSYPNTPVTIHSLLTHTSSLLDTDDLSATRSAGAKSRLGGSGFRRMTPGSIESWSYNNYGFAVLGMTMELAAGETLDQILHRELFTAMDIDASFAPDYLEREDLLATVYRCGGSVGRSVNSQKGPTRSWKPGQEGSFFAGGFTSSARDLGKLTALLASDGVYQGVQLLSEDAVAAMEAHEDYLLSGNFYQCHPLRYQADLYGREGLFYHTGSAYGVYNFLSYDPLTGDGVVVLTSGADGVKDSRGIYAICGEIAQAVYDATKEA